MSAFDQKWGGPGENEYDDAFVYGGESDGEDGEDNYYDPGEVKLVAAYSDMERTGGGRIAGTGIADGSMAKNQQRINRITQTPIEQMTNSVNAIVTKLSDNGVYISEENITILLDKIHELPYVGGKNATAYILGHLASRGGRGIIKSEVDKVFKYIDNKIVDESVGKPDVIRYANLWISL